MKKEEYKSGQIFTEWECGQIIHRMGMRTDNSQNGNADRYSQNENVDK